MSSQDKTTVTIRERTRERLAEYEHGDHDSVDETLNEMMCVLPSPEDISEGCLMCDGNPRMTGDIGEMGGIVDWFTDPHDGRVISNYFCSKSCLRDHLDQIDEQAPKRPDKVIVGGKEMRRFEVEGHTSFMLDGKAQTVEFEVPVDVEEYEGEPIYVVNAGKVRFDGVVDDPMVVDGRAYASLKYDKPVSDEFYPEDF